MNRAQATATALLAGNGLCLLKLADVVTDASFSLPEGFDFSLPTLVFIAGVGTACSFVIYQWAHGEGGEEPNQYVWGAAMLSPVGVWLALLSLAGFAG